MFLKSKFLISATFWLCCFTLGDFGITSISASNYGGHHGRYCYKEGWFSNNGDCGVVYVGSSASQGLGKAVGIRWMDESEGDCGGTFGAKDVSDTYPEDKQPFGTFDMRQINFNTADGTDCKATK